MKERRKLLNYFFVLIFIAIVFAIAWLLGKTRLGLLDNLPFTGASPTQLVTTTPTATPLPNR
jgi:ABC-type uncharacterized transport system permease subunit